MLGGCKPVGPRMQPRYCQLAMDNNGVGVAKTTHGPRPAHEPDLQACNRIHAPPHDLHPQGCRPKCPHLQMRCSPLKPRHAPSPHPLLRRRAHHLAPYHSPARLLLSCSCRQTSKRHDPPRHSRHLHPRPHQVRHNTAHTKASQPSQTHPSHPSVCPCHRLPQGLRLRQRLPPRHDAGDTRLHAVPQRLCVARRPGCTVHALRQQQLHQC
jgi:hypothetical protein